MLTAFIKERHDHVDPVGSGRTGADDTLQILVVVIRRHMVHITGHFVGQGVVGHIHHGKHICTAHRLSDDTLAFAAAKARAGAVQEIRVHIVATVLKVLLSAH